MVNSSNRNKDITQAEVIIKYFEKNPNRDIPHPEIVDWVTDEYKKELVIFSETRIDKLDNFIKKDF